MNSLNKIMLIGNVGADPDIRSTPAGAQVANFRVACTERWTDQQGQKQERTEWITVVAWRGLADVIQRFVRKGSKVYVEGKLTTRTWEDRNGGGKRYATEVVASELILLSYANDGQGGSPRQAGEQGSLGDDFGNPNAGSAAPAGDDDLPF